MIEDALRASLKPGDFIIYKGAYSFLWKAAQVKNPNPMYVIGDDGERVFYRRIAGVGATREAAMATVVELSAESQKHRDIEAEEGKRHRAAISAILAASR